MISNGKESSHKYYNSFLHDPLHLDLTVHWLVLIYNCDTVHWLVLIYKDHIP